jgi:uncharacterized protein (TIRG00374 family)
VNPAVFTLYRQPIMLVEGKMQYLFDETGRRYLDLLGGIVTVSVGHCHPRVLQAISDQLGLLQHATTIYLHPNLARLAEKLAGKMPEGLDVTYFVNSGSEANDLAITMARLYTGHHDVIALRNAYHGGSPSAMGLTSHHTWKFPLQQASGVHHALCPDTYRNPLEGSPEEVARQSAADVRELIRFSTPGKVAAFIAEGLIIAGGMGALGAYLTPMQAGSSPVQIYAMKRTGFPVPKALATVLMTFIATVIFFAVAGPLALYFGAGESLGERGVVLGLSLLDLFRGSIMIFAALAVLLILVMVAPRVVSNAVHRLAEVLSRRSTKIADRLEHLRDGIDQAHASMQAFNTVRGWVALFWATIISGPSHANKLRAGYVALRAVGIQANFADILLLQTLITFLLYFAPTPGGSGVAEVLSLSVMSVYVPRELTPVYTLVWRCILTWFTIGAGFVVFSAWVRGGLREIELKSG